MTDARAPLLALAAELEAEAAGEGPRNSGTSEAFIHAARLARERASALAPAGSMDVGGPDAEHRIDLERAVRELTSVVDQLAARLDERGRRAAARLQRDPSSTTGARVDAAPPPPPRRWHREGHAPGPLRAGNVGFGRP